MNGFPDYSGFFRFFNSVFLDQRLNAHPLKFAVVIAKNIYIIRLFMRFTFHPQINKSFLLWLLALSNNTKNFIIRKYTLTSTCKYMHMCRKGYSYMYMQTHTAPSVEVEASSLTHLAYP